MYFLFLCMSHTIYVFAVELHKKIYLATLPFFRKANLSLRASYNERRACTKLVAFKLGAARLRYFYAPNIYSIERRELQLPDRISCNLENLRKPKNILMLTKGFNLFVEIRELVISAKASYN